VDDGVGEGEVDDLADVSGDGPQLRRGGERNDVSAGVDGGAQQRRTTVDRSARPGHAGEVW
jgi:hypothetical protein